MSCPPGKINQKCAPAELIAQNRANDISYNFGYEDGLLEAEAQLLPKIQEAEAILQACIAIERTVTGRVQNEYSAILAAAQPFVDNQTILQKSKTLANAITAGTCP